MLVAPTELRHSPFRALAIGGRGSAVPEKHGVDFLFYYRKRPYGVQRKAIPDFLASVTDGRLYRECAQMQSLERAVLVLEGRVEWDLNGNLLKKEWGARWTRTQFHSYLLSVRAKGIWVETTADVEGTAEFLKTFEAWVRKERHIALETRPGAQAAWGERGHRDFQRHVVMSFDGMGYERAERWIEHFGGTGLEWRVSEEEMREVPGVGPVLAKRLREAL